MISAKFTTVVNRWSNGHDHIGTSDGDVGEDNRTSHKWNTVITDCNHLDDNCVDDIVRQHYIFTLFDQFDILSTAVHR